MQDLQTIKKLIKLAEDEFTNFEKDAQTGFDYYNNKGKIKQTGAAAINEVNAYLKLKGGNPLKSADNRVGLNRHMIVVDQKIGYLFADPPTFSVAKDSTGSKSLMTQVSQVLDAQFAEVIKQIGTDAANTGRGWLAYWKDESGKFDYWYINPLTVLPIYDRSTPKRKLKYLIRRYGYADDKGESVTRYEVWDDKEVAYLIKKTANSKSAIDFERLPDEQYNIVPHDYGRIPFIEFRNNAKAFYDLMMYKDIIDAMDKLVSGFCNDVDDLQEIIWVIKNYAGETSQVDYDKDGKEIEKTVDLLQMLKAKKWVAVDEKGGIDTVRGEIPHEARTKLFELLDKQFWVAAMAVDPNPERIGNQSGEYMEFLYGLLEQKASLTETMFRTALDEFLQAIVKHIGIDTTIKFMQTWKRTKPRNDKETIENINSTPSTVMSDATKTKLHPYIEDAESERKQIEKETAEREQNLLDQYKQLEDEPSGGDAN